jgi:hypothetical protein
MKIEVLLCLLNVHLCKKFFTRISIVFLLLGTFIGPSLAQTAEQKFTQDIMTLDGQILFAPMYSLNTYLIDNTGVVNHQWSSSYFPGESVRWLGNGAILRTIKTDLSGWGGDGGGVQKILWDGTITWEFIYDTSEYISHHDVMPLPNGNVLMIAWENKTRTEAIAAGRNPNSLLGNLLMIDKIIEVKPTGPTSGTIVWEWHVWDHLIQDYDSSKTNYGEVGDHPELVDINYIDDVIFADLLHTNSIDYNETFDQILLSACYFSEVWVIDHSTTTEEAASHTGGRSGKGGDLLYRWGNPEAYRAGTESDQKLFYQHDTTWIKAGCPGEGNILVFNNGKDRPDGRYSSVDEIAPPVDENGEYYLEPGSAYGPAAQTWIYTANPPGSFYSSKFSGAERLPDGNTLICNGEKGIFFEVTSTGTTVWTYTNPYPMIGGNQVFKIVYIPPGEEPPEPNASDLDCSGSLSWANIKPGATVTGSFQVQNIGNSNSSLNWKIYNTTSITWGTWSFTPESGENLQPGDGQVTIQVSVIAPDEKNAEFEGYILVENIDNPNDFEVIPVSLKTPVSINPAWWTMLHQFFSYFLHRHLFIEKLWNLFIYNI